MTSLLHQITSDGGELRYTLRYTTLGSSPRLTTGADVIMHGNGHRLYAKHFSRPFVGVETEARISLREDAWYVQERFSTSLRREQFMHVLQNVDYILIKSNYDQQQDDVR